MFKSPTSTVFLNSTQTTTATMTNIVQNSITSTNIRQTSNNQNISTIIRKSSNSLKNNNANNVSNLVMNPMLKRKVNGYCECCKQRFDNLKQVYFFDFCVVFINFFNLN